MYIYDLNPWFSWGRGTVFATHLLNVLRMSGIQGFSDSRWGWTVHSDTYINWTPAAGGFSPWDSLEGGTVFFNFLKTELAWTGSRPGHIDAESCPLLNSLWQDLVFCSPYPPPPAFFFFFRRVNTHRMFLIPEAAWVSSVFLLRAHQEERLVFQQCHCHV